jgi:hypothetical protein
MTSTFQSSTPAFNADFKISGMELNHLQAIGKLMQAFRPADYSMADTLDLTPDDVNSLGELVVFLAQSRMNFDEESSEFNTAMMRQAVEKAQLDAVELMAESFKKSKKAKSKK